MASSVWLVSVCGYDSCDHAGWFTDPDEARGYAERLKMCTRDPEDVTVTECRLDRPWRELQGAYVVELAADGRIVVEGWEDWSTPDGTQWEGLPAHFWMSDGERVTTDEGAVLRAVGYDRAEALERAHSLLARTPPPNASVEPAGTGREP